MYTSKAVMVPAVNCSGEKNMFDGVSLNSEVKSGVETMVYIHPGMCIRSQLIWCQLTAYY